MACVRKGIVLISVKSEKRCPKCGEMKPASEFYKCKTRGDGLSGYCKDCTTMLMKTRYRENHAPKRRLTDREYYHKNRERCLENSKRYRESRLELLWELKTPCVKCGEDRKCCIHFHHIDPKEKTCNLSDGNVGKEKIIEECKKCICLCANCHEEFHWLYGHNPENPIESLEEYLRG